MLSLKDKFTYFTMNVAKFQLVLNHDDLDVICKGIQEFSSTVLKECDAEESFGYRGRCRKNTSIHVLTPALPGSVVGLLFGYLSSSPQIEEIFIVWSLVDRSSNYELCIALNHCVAVILHCAKSLENVCNDIINRILHEFWRNITAMLDSNNTDLVHSCLSLLIAMSRTSKNNCEQVLQKLNFSDNMFTSMIQRGKTKQTGMMTSTNLSVLVDSRILLIILVFTLMLDTNEAGLERLLASSITKKIMHSLSKDLPVSLELILNAVLFLVEKSSVVRGHLLDFLDAGCIDKLLNLYQSEDVAMQSIVDKFFNQLIQLSSHLLQNNDLHSFALRVCLSNVVKLLRPLKDKRHRQLQVEILSALPYLMKQSINCDNFNWEHAPINAEYSSLLIHLANVLTVSPFDAKQKDSLRQKFQNWEGVPKKMQASQSAQLVQEIIESLLPSGLGKNELTKLIKHTTPSVAVCGLKLLRAALLRLHRLLSDAGVGRALFQRVASSLFFKWLPDSSALLDLTLKSVKVSFSGSAESSGAAVNNEDKQVVAVESTVDDFDFNFLGSNGKTTGGAPMEVEGENDETDVGAGAMPSAVHEVSLEVMALYSALFASSASTSATAANGGSDVLKLLNETVTWSSEASAVDALIEVEASLSPVVLSSVLVVLKRVAATAGWFGHRNEVGKVLASLAQLKGLHAVVYQQPLTKLLLLCSSKQESLASDGLSLLKQVLLRSGLFEGHGVSDFELHCEAQCWLHFVALKTVHVPFLSTLLSAAYHYSADLCCLLWGSEANPEQLTAPLSSLSLCLLMLAAGETNTFSPDFPRQLQVALSGNSMIAYQQRADFQSILLDWLNVVVKYSPEPLKYLKSFRTALRLVVGVSKEDESFSSIASAVSNYIDLLSFASIADEKQSIQVQKQALVKISGIPDGRIIPGSLKESSRTSAALLALAALNITDLVEVPADTNIFTTTLYKHWQLVFALYVSTAEQIAVWVVDFMSKRWQADMLVVTSSGAKQLLVHTTVVLCKKLLEAVAQRGSVAAASAPKAASKNKKRKNPDSEEEDPISEVKKFCFNILEGLSSLLDTSGGLSLSSVLSSVSATCLVEHFLDPTDFGEWCRLLLLVMVESISGKQQASVQSLWSTLATGIHKHCGSGAKTEKTLTRLCCAVYKCTGSFDLRVILSRLDPVALNQLDAANELIDSNNHGGIVTIDELLNSKGSMKDAMSLVAELCLLPVVISADGFVTEPLVVNYSHGNHVDWTVFVPNSDVVLQQFTSKDRTIEDLAAVTAFLQSSYPSMFGKTGSTLLPSYEAICDKVYPLLSTALATIGSSMASSVTVGQLTVFIKCVVLPPCKGKLLSALQSLTNLMISASEAKESYKIVLLNFVRRFIVEYRQFHDRLLTDDLLSQTLLELNDAGVVVDDRTSQLPVLWIMAHSSILKLYLSVSTNMLIKSQPSVDSVKLKMQVNRVRSLLLCAPMKINVAGISGAANKDLAFHAELNKWVKCCLKYELDNELVLSVLQQLMSRLQSVESDSVIAVLSTHDPENDSNALSCPVLFNMIAGHSKVNSVLMGHDQRVKIGLIRLLLILLRSVLVKKFISEIKDSLVFLSEPLWTLYKGTTSILDLLLLRFFQLLEGEGNLPVALSLMRVGSTYRLNDGKIALTASWLFDFLLPPTVYSTLSKFDVSRSVVSVPFSWESSEVSTRDSLNDGGAIGGSAYDIGYFLPVIFSTLRNFDVSIRRLTNCGGLSLVLIGLSSACATTRSYALASLHLIYLLIHKQTPEVDPSFRERNQLLHLLSWVKNSILSGKDRKVDDISVPSVPPMIGTFLGRAVLNIMQPNHELYSAINKYILSRPWCDWSDVPLLDFLLDQSESQTQVSERLAVLRLLGDGLITAQDHNNLCRKNGYNRLMLMFCIHSTDVRIGYAILDVIEQGLIIRQSAKYLIERCDLLSWLQAIVTTTSKFKVKALTLLRSVIGYCYLASQEDSNEETQTVQKLLINVAQSFVVDEDVSSELLRLLLLCLWDMCLMFTAENCIEGWNFDLIVKLYNVAVSKNLSEDFLLSIVSLGAYSTGQVDKDDSKRLLDLVQELVMPFRGKDEVNSSDGKGPYDNLANHLNDTANLWNVHSNFSYRSSRLPCSCDRSLLLASAATIVARCDESECNMKLLRWAVELWQTFTATIGDESSIARQLGRVCLRALAQDPSAISWIDKDADRTKVLRLSRAALEIILGTQQPENRNVYQQLNCLSRDIGLLALSSMNRANQWPDFKYADHSAASVHHWIMKMDLLLKGPN